CIVGDTQVCIDTRSSRQHCGGCNVTCGAGEICLQGVCVCGQSETGPGPGGGAACTGNTVCCQEACVPPADPLCQCGGGGGEGTVCTPDEFCCADSCVNVDEDDANCGACKNACPSAQNCVDGDCRCPPDQPNFCIDRCVNVTADPMNCGACGNECQDTE